MTVSLDQQIACVRREIALRKNVYAKRVSSYQMRQSEADHEIAAMQAVHDTVMAVKRLRATMAEHIYTNPGCACGLAPPEPPTTPMEAFAAWLDHVFERSKAAAADAEGAQT